MCYLFYISIFYTLRTKKRKRIRINNKKRNRTTQIDAFKVKNPVLPQSLHGEKCNATKRKHIVNDKHYHKGKHQVNGLVYDWKQMPTTDDKKGFIHVIRSPETSEESYIFEIIIDANVSIYIEYLKEIPSKSIKKFVAHVLQHHTPVRDVDDESGTIAAGGKRFDPTSATVIDYVPSGKITPKEEGNHLNF